ncbi:MAG TPA: hypothetical protein VKD91_01335 [Pyrinomonadaceae bacterium]|nr:hypothetical protein [Pyrinomonadaceae bacterium]
MNTKSRGHFRRGYSVGPARDNSIKTRVSSLAALTLIAVVAGVAAIKANAKTNPTGKPAVAATIISPRDPQATLNFGSFGIAQGQVARMNLVSLAHPGEADPPQPDRAELILLGEDGKALASQPVVIGPGECASLQFSMDDLGITGNRLQLRAKVRFVDPPNPDADPPGEHTIATVEVVDRSGRTSLMLPYFIKGTDPPQPDLGQ